MLSLNQIQGVRAILFFRVLLNEIRDHYKDPLNKPYPREDSQLLLEVIEILYILYYRVIQKKL